MENLRDATWADALSPSMPANSADLSKLRLGATRENLPDQLAAAISDAILSGAFRPGDRLQPDDIARHFDISKIPVREALRTVEANGWVRSRPRRGTFVASPTLQDLKDVFETRIMLEPGLARRAALRRSEDQVRALDRIMERTLLAIEKGDPRKIEEANSEFHALIAESAKNPFAERIITQIELRVRWYFTNVPLNRSRNTAEEHYAILNAVRNRDEDGAEAATLDHLRNTLRVALSGETTEGLGTQERAR